MKKPFSVMILAVVILTGCKHESELRKSVFIPDPASPELPVYSEWGYNTFGVYFDRKPFRSNDKDVPIKVINRQNSTSLLFTGERSDPATGYYTYPVYMAFTLTIDDLNPATYADLLALDNTTMDLSESKYRIEITDDTTTFNPQLLGGTFQVKHARLLMVDGQPEEVILSGQFEVQVLINQVPITFSDGRFDLGVSTYNFFKY